jgi:hypothetical protein
LKHDTIKHHVEKGEIEIVQQEMKKIYPSLTEDEINIKSNKMMSSHQDKNDNENE